MIKDLSTIASRGIEIDLSGPGGNVFYLIAQAKRLGATLKLTRKEINDIRDDMMSADYENAINVFDKSFGLFVTLYR